MVLSAFDTNTVRLQAGINANINLLPSFYEQASYPGRTIFCRADSAGDLFLGAQGVIWDTQSDMLCAVVGAICMVLFLGKVLQKQIGKLKSHQNTINLNKYI